MTTSTQTQLRRGTGTQCDAMTPAQGEMIVDTTNKRPRVGDGATAGGIILPNVADQRGQTFMTGTIGGTGNAITITMTPALAAYAANQRFVWQQPADNTGSAQLNAGPGLVTIKKKTASGLSVLSGGELKSGGIYAGVHDGTYIQLESVDQGYKPGLVSIATSTPAPNTVTTVSLTSLSQAYRDLVIRWTGVQPTISTRKLLIQPSAGAGFTGSYVTGAQLFPTGGGSGSGWQAVADFGQSGLSTTQTNTQTIDGEIIIRNYADTNGPKFYDLWTKLSGGTTEFIASGVINANAAIDGIKFYWNSTGNFNAGTMTVFGAN